jgi:hypothetical protein
MNESDVKQWFDRLMSAETVTLKETISFFSVCQNRIQELKRKPKNDSTMTGDFFGTDNTTWTI